MPGVVKDLNLCCRESGLFHIFYDTLAVVMESRTKKGLFQVSCSIILLPKQDEHPLYLYSLQFLFVHHILAITNYLTNWSLPLKITSFKGEFSSYRCIVKLHKQDCVVRGFLMHL